MCVLHHSDRRFVSALGHQLVKLSSRFDSGFAVHLQALWYNLGCSAPSFGCELVGPVYGSCCCPILCCRSLVERCRSPNARSFVCAYMARGRDPPAPPAGAGFHAPGLGIPAPGRDFMPQRLEFPLPGRASLRNQEIPPSDPYWCVRNIRCPRPCQIIGSGAIDVTKS